MNKTIKRFVAVLMALLLCCAVLPVYSFAITDTSIITKVVDGVSEYGYIQYHYEDMNGNTVEVADGDLYSPGVSSHGRKAGRSTLPASYNSFNLGYITPAKDQNPFGCCWAFAAIGVMEAYAVKNMGSDIDETDYSEAHLVWYANTKSTDSNDPMFGDGLNYSDPYNYGGNPGMAALCFAKGSGVTLESDYPFDNTDVSNMGNYNDATARYEHNIGLLDSAVSLTDPNEIKQAIIDNGAVTAAYYHHDSFMNHDGSTYVYSDGSYAPYCCTFAAYYLNQAVGTNHGVMIVGWDDNYSTTNFKSGCRPTSNGAWICKNSWGDEFGVNGLFWISYEDANICNFYTYTMTDDYDYVTSHSGTCFASKRSISNASNPSKTASIFVSDGEKTLDAAGFWIQDDNVPATVKVYKNIPASPSGPEYGSPVATATATFRTGYNTVKFSSPVTLHTGDRYSIVAELTPVNGEISIPLEGNNSSYQSKTSFYQRGEYPDYWFECSSSVGNTYVYAYTNDLPQTVSAQSISIDQNSQSLYIGQTLQLSATVLPVNTDNPAVAWSSSAPAVASVDQFGLVYADGVGSAVITASTTDGSNLSNSITITVLDNHFTVTYYVDTSQYAVLTYIMGQQAPPPASPSKTGYNFSGWLDSSGNPVSFPLTVNSDMSLYASFIPRTDIPYTLNVYTMDTQGSYPDTPDSVQTYYGTTGETVTAGYTVPEGFSLDSSSTVTGTVQGDGSLVLTAYLSRNIYSITAINDDVVEVYAFYYGERVEPFAALPPDGYIFAGWQPCLPGTMPAENLTVTPVFVVHSSRPSIKIVTTNELNLNAGESVTVYAAVSGDNSSEVVWSVFGSAFEITPSDDGKSCVVTALSGGKAVIRAALVSSAGTVLCSDSVTATGRTGLRYLLNRIFGNSQGKFISFFELFRLLFFNLV